MGGDFNATPYNSTIKTLDSYGYVRSGVNLNQFTIPSTAPNSELESICIYQSDRFDVEEHRDITATNASDHLPLMPTLTIT